MSGSYDVQEVSKELVDPERLKPGRIDDKHLFIKLFQGGLTHDEISKVFGVNRVSVTNMVARLGLNREKRDPQAFKAVMEDEMLIRMERILENLTPDKMTKATLSQLVMAFGVLFDKVRLHRGESTANVAVANVHKMDPKALDSIRKIIQEQTREKLESARKQYQPEA